MKATVAPTTEAISTAAVSSRGRKKFRKIPPTLTVGIALALAAIVIALLGGVVSGADPDEQSLANKLTPPGVDGFILGSDLLGRDMLARVAQGIWWSLPVGLAAATIAVAVGVLLGLLAGWSTGIVRRVINQVVDVSIAFPYMVLAILLIAILGRGFWPMVLSLGLIAWVSVTKIVYTEVLSLTSRQYILTARLQGIPVYWILATYVFRAVRARIIVAYAFMFANLLVAEASLSFLGLGAPVGFPSWGSMLRDSREYLGTAPWLMLVPGGMVVLVVLAANLIGDGLIKWFRISGDGQVNNG